MRLSKVRLLGLTSVCLYAMAATNDRLAMYALCWVCVSLAVVSYILVRLGLVGLRVERLQVPSRLTAGQALELPLEVHNIGSLAKVNLRVGDRIVNEISGRTIYREALLTWLPGHRSVTLDAAGVRLRRGLARVGPLTVTASDPLGMFERRRNLDGRAREVIIHPAVVDLPGWLGDGSWTGQAAQRERAPQGLDFRNLRHYELGDDLRHLDWKATARTGQLHIREYERPVAHNATVALDLHHGQVWGEGETSSLEVGIVACASLLLRLRRLGYTQRLVGCDTAPFEFTSGPGRHPAVPVMDRLALAQGVGEVPLLELLERQVGRFSGDRLLVVITGCASPELAQWLAKTRGAGRQRALVVLLDPTAFVRPATGPLAEARRRETEACCDILKPTAIQLVRLGPADDLSRLLTCQRPRA